MNRTINQFNDIFSKEMIDYLLNLPNVLNAKTKIDKKSNGLEYFNIILTSEIRDILQNNFGLNLENINSIPMRWIKGDTLPHIDNGINHFENTHLIYLTDSQGELNIDGKSYPIVKNCGYVFSEGLKHETINTGYEPRLLLGPMSEIGFSVGAAVILTGPGNSTIYIRQNNDNIEFSFNYTEWYNISSWPCVVLNTDTSLGILKIEFTTDITLKYDYQYFITNSNENQGYIQYGSTSLNVNGTRPIITIDEVTNYPGLIKNGSSEYDGCESVYVFNLEVNIINNSTLAESAGWIGQIYFGKGVENNYFVNCSSNGNLPGGSTGGIVGAYAGSSGGNLSIIGCYSLGNIGNTDGGIVGEYAGDSGGTVKCEQCWSLGTIGNNAGGIYSQNAGSNAGNVYATNCYSLGSIGISSGGIYGNNAGNSYDSYATNCYSRGNIAENGGGIYGQNAGLINFGTANAENCYSLGIITTEGNGIFGTDENAVQNYCYAANGNWDTDVANLSLYNTPDTVNGNNIGSTWAQYAVDTPYILSSIGYSPYTINNIYYMAKVPALNKLSPPVGNEPKKDMSTDLYDSELVPADYQTVPADYQIDLFPNLVSFIDENIVKGDKDDSDRLNASYWDDLGNDVFDEWGFFYLYDVTSEKYYFPLLRPYNGVDGVITTNIFNAFDRTFTFKYGWSIRGIYKIDISVNDELPFRFGAYGNMGSDEDTKFSKLTYNYTLNSQDRILYYHCNVEENSIIELLYTYIVPKNISDNVLTPYDVYYNDDDNMSIMTKEFTQGVTVYFSKSYDVREFVVNDIKADAGESDKIYTINTTGTTDTALISNRSYTILQKIKGTVNIFEGGDADVTYQVLLNDTTININSTTGEITTSNTPEGIYEVYVFNNEINSQSYNISKYYLYVKESESNENQEIINSIIFTRSNFTNKNVLINIVKQIGVNNINLDDGADKILFELLKRK
jgi:hypothetical protein